MRILVLSNYPWKNNNSFGNTYSGIFKNVPNTEIAHIYMFDGHPDFVPNVTRYYQISEREIIKSVTNRKKRVGKEVLVETKDVIKDSQISKAKKETSYGKLLSFGKRHHWNLMFFARELAWKLGRVNYEGLMDFIEDFKPDLFFLPYSNVFYTNRIASYIKKHYNFPMVLEMAMDHYTFKRVSWNPLFWIDRIAKRRVIRQLASQSELLFVISKKLKVELEGDLKIPCRVLYKTPDMGRPYQPYIPEQGKLKFLFTGNIYANRWKSLAMLAEGLKKEGIGELDIYTSTPISKRMDKALNIPGASVIHSPVSQPEVVKLQNQSDVLVHAEAFDKYNKSLVRCAVSTKIMDYLCAGRCILAIGPSDISSIEYLSENDLALIASQKEQLESIIDRIKNDKSIIVNYSKKGREYVKENLDEMSIRSEFRAVLQQVIDNYKHKS